MIGLLLSSALIIFLVVKMQVSDRICDEATNRIIYSDEEYSTESEKIEFENSFKSTEKISKQVSERMSSETFTKDFDEEDFTDARTEKDAEELLKKIYAGGGKNK